MKFGINDINTDNGPVIWAITGRAETERFTASHSHAPGQLFASLSGLLSVGLDDGVWIVPAIHAVWLPPHTHHAIRSHGPFHGWGAYVAEAACAELPKRACTLRISGLLSEAVLRAAAWPVSPLDAACARAAAALIADPADARDLDQWAAVGAISSRTLSRRFVEQTGFTFTAWRQRARLMRSLELLAADVPINAIALELGYSTASVFIGLFRRTFGATPAMYRQGLDARS